MLQKFIVFSKNTPLISFSSDKETNYRIQNLHVFDQYRYLLPFEMRGRQTQEFVESWLARRITVLGRRTLAAIEETKRLDKNDLLRFAKVTHALSLNDTFWLRPEESTLTWEDANLFHNPFSEELAQFGISSVLRKTIALASRSPQYTLKGAMAKCWYRRNGKLLLCKTDTRQKPFLLSQACMEWIASEIAERFGIPHAEYWLEQKETSSGMRICSMCEAFTSEHTGFVEAFNYYAYRGVPEDSLRNEHLFRDIAFQRILSRYFAHEQISDMMVFDYIIGNTDRHLNNYGLLFDTDSGEILGPAPVFDNGLSFFAWDVIPQSERDVEDWISENDLTTTFSGTDQLEEFLQPCHEQKLARVADFRCTAVPQWNFTQHDADMVNTFLKIRVRQAYDVLYARYPELQKHGSS